MALTLVLHLDLNGTLILADSTKSGNEIVAEISSLLSADWDGSGRVMTYKRYVQKVLEPGDRYEPGRRARQEALFADLPSLLEREEKHSHLRDQARQIYDSLRHLEDERLGRATMTPFASFAVLVESLKVAVTRDVRIVIRTFGPDGDAFGNALRAAGWAVSGSVVRGRGERGFDWDGDRIEAEEALSRLLALPSGEVLIVRDDFDSWVAGGKRGRAGKRVFGSASGVHPDGRGGGLLTAFLDDNHQHSPDGDDISSPFCIHEVGEKATWEHKGFCAARVNSYKAATDERYLVDLILPVIREKAEVLKC